MTKEILIGSMKNEQDKTGSPVELIFSDLSPSNACEGWSVSALKVQVAPGDTKPISISFTAPKSPPGHNLGGVGYPFYSTLQLQGVLKGGSPATRDPQGQKVVLEIKALCNPWNNGENPTGEFQLPVL